ncbi:hypothetical protein, partial [Pyxidicoccus fallax]
MSPSASWRTCWAQPALLVWRRKQLPTEILPALACASARTCPSPRTDRFAADSRSVISDRSFEDPIPS